MRTSDRKNLKRLKMMDCLRETNASDYNVKRNQLLQDWMAEASRRLNDASLPPATDLIRIADQFGLGNSLRCAIIDLVHTKLDGPSFRSYQTLLNRWKEKFGKEL